MSETGKNLTFEQTKTRKYTVGLYTEVNRAKTTSTTTLHGGEEDHILLNIGDFQFNAAPDGNLYLNHLDLEKEELNIILTIDPKGNIRPNIKSFKSKKEAQEENDLSRGAMYCVDGKVYLKQ